MLSEWPLVVALRALIPFDTLAVSEEEQSQRIG